MQKKEFQFAAQQSITLSMPKERSSEKPFSKKQSKNPGTPFVRTKSLVTKVANVIDCADPLCQRDLARTYGVSQTTVAHIISVDLGMKYKKKQKTHKLTDKQAAQRLARGPTFRRWPNQRKLLYIVTLNEIYFSTNNTIGKKDGYYEKTAE